MTSLLDRPVKERTFAGLSVRRRIVDRTATVLVTVAMLVALAPLAWVLYTVVAKGVGAVASPTWWWHSQAGMTAFTPGGGAYHAIVGTVLQGLVCAAISIPIGIFVAIYLVEYGAGSRLGK
ncbi:MAG TPA: phosphate ABC transporter, permease protein PstA, partial [Mycobacterium sp.]|nr:phosphate ABC transporter, permease protein PstA [Mycobacterium sp.]